MAWPPPSPPPRGWICEKPVGWGERDRLEMEVDGDPCDMPLYLRTLDRLAMEPPAPPPKRAGN